MHVSRAMPLLLVHFLGVIRRIWRGGDAGGVHRIRIRLRARAPFIGQTKCLRPLHVYTYIYIPETSARFARAMAHGMTLWDYIMGSDYGTILRDNITG